MATKPICSINDCDKSSHSKGWCTMHYQRWKKHGDPLKNKNEEIPATDRYISEIVIPYEGNDCLIWPFSKNTKGYARIVRENRTIIVSRLVCEKVNGTPPTQKHQAAHSCGNGHLGCVTKGHLSWKTRSGNEADKLIHGTHSRGTRSIHSKLSDDDAREIRRLKGSVSQFALADRYGVARSTIASIHQRKSWDWLPD